MRVKVPGCALLAGLALAACGDRVEPMGAAAFMPDAPTAADRMADDRGAPPAMQRTMVAGWPMSAQRDIVANLESSPQHSRFVAALTAGDLDGELSNAGAYTVFAPTNAAFAAVPSMAGGQLPAGLAAAHVVPGRLTAFELSQRMQMGAGRLTTLSGATLTVIAGPDGLRIRDAGGREARVIGADGLQSNGVVHVVDRVLAG
jgi:uncharacterized surface protein with fasciclin (FAS1) repeats